MIEIKRNKNTFFFPKEQILTRVAQDDKVKQTANIGEPNYKNKTYVLDQLQFLQILNDISGNQQRKFGPYFLKTRVQMALQINLKNESNTTVKHLRK